jgi:hypothetical protein
MDLEEKQADMRFRIAQAKLEKKRKRAPLTQRRREFEILYALYCFTNHTASYDDLHLTSRCRPFGRGWWMKTFWPLERAGKLEWIRDRDIVRLTKAGRSFVINQLSRDAPDI